MEQGSVATIPKRHANVVTASEPPHILAADLIEQKDLSADGLECAFDQLRTLMRPDTLTSSLALYDADDEGGEGRDDESCRDGEEDEEESVCSLEEIRDLSVRQVYADVAEKDTSIIGGPRGDDPQSPSEDSDSDRCIGDDVDFTEIDKDAALAEYRQLYFTLDPVVAALDIVVDGPLPGFIYDGVLYTFADSTNGTCLQCSNTAALRYSGFPSCEEYDQIMAVYGLLRRINGYSHDSRSQVWWKSIGRWMDSDCERGDDADVDDEYEPRSLGFLDSYNCEDLEDDLDIGSMSPRRIEDILADDIDRLSPMLYDAYRKTGAAH